jgi:hypothetical protein
VSVALQLHPPATWKGLGGDILVEAGFEDLYDDGYSLPYKLPDGTAVYSKRFGVSGSSWYSPSPLDVGGLVPYGLEAIPWGQLRTDDVLFVCEGESDALCARERIAELDGRRVFALALPGASTWRAAWMRFLRPFSAVYVVPDGDEPGRRMAARIRQDCRWARIVSLPGGDDLRSFVQREGAEALLPLLDESTWLLQLELGIRTCRRLELMDAFMRRPML